MLRRITALALAALTLASCNQNAAIQVTGSSTIYPFTKAVAAAYVERDSKRKVPAIESTGTGSGVQTFCKKGGETPDILDASRRMTRTELTQCKANGTGDIIELRIGLDGIALAESNQGPKFAVTSKDLYLALAANPNGKPNTAKTWRDVNPTLPAVPILVLGPPRSSGTHDMFVSLIMRSGCLNAMPTAAALMKDGDQSKFSAACLQIRTDGPYVEEGESDNAIVTALEQKPNALGLFGYSYLEQNSSKLRAVSIDGITPDAATIADGKYIGYRTLYIYVNKARLKSTPGLKDFLRLYLEMAAAGGPLVKIGLIAMAPTSLKRARDTLENEFPLDPQDII